MAIESLTKTLPESGLIAITWAGVGSATIFILGRMTIRVSKIQKLRMDDYLICLAFAALVINGILQTLQTLDAYYVTKAEFGLIPVSQELVDRGGRYLKYKLTITGLIFTVLWLVKASFLALFYQLFEGLPNYRRIWWAVVVFSSLAYIGCWIASINNCRPASVHFTLGACNKPTVITISYTAAADVATDFMIMAMPLNLLWNLQISQSEKIGLASVFSVALVTVIFAIIRAMQITFTARTDPVWVSLWGIVESSVCKLIEIPRALFIGGRSILTRSYVAAVVVGCLPPYKSLFAPRQHSTTEYVSGNYGNLSYNSRSAQNGSTPLQTYSSTFVNVTGSVRQLDLEDSRCESPEAIVEPTSYLTQDFIVRKDVYRNR